VARHAQGGKEGEKGGGVQDNKETLISSSLIEGKAVRAVGGKEKGKTRTAAPAGEREKEVAASGFAGRPFFQARRRKRRQTARIEEGEDGNFLCQGQTKKRRRKYGASWPSRGESDSPPSIGST